MYHEALEYCLNNKIYHFNHFWYSSVALNATAIGYHVYPLLPLHCITFHCSQMELYSFKCNSSFLSLAPGDKQSIFCFCELPTLVLYGVMQCLSFCIWFISLKIISSRFQIHVFSPPHVLNTLCSWRKSSSFLSIWNYLALMCKCTFHLLSICGK